MHITGQKWQSGDKLLNNSYDFVSAAHSPQQRHCRHMWTGLGIPKNRNRLNSQIWAILLTIRIWLESKHEMLDKRTWFSNAGCRLSCLPLPSWLTCWICRTRGILFRWVECLCTAFTDFVDILIFAVAFANVPTKYQSPSNWCGSFRGYLRAQKHKLYHRIHSNLVIEYLTIALLYWRLLCCRTLLCTSLHVCRNSL